jgi:ATP-dependent exoDNAse (exonuclease V) beta subunit
LYILKEYFKNNKEVFDYTIINDEEFKDIQKEFKNEELLIDKYLNEYNLLTFDKIIEKFIQIIKEDKNFQLFITNYLNEVIVDEAQDLDEKQYEILELLKKYNKDLKLFFVGDQRQNIYDFRGGSLNHIEKNISN